MRMDQAKIIPLVNTNLLISSAVSVDRIQVFSLPRAEAWITDVLYNIISVGPISLVTLPHSI